MTVKIVKIKDSFRDTLIEALDRNDTSSKIRPYYLGVAISDEIEALLPIRGNCPKSYSVLLNSTKDKKRPGLDCSKMILIKKSEINDKTSVAHIEKTLIKDIEAKKNIIIEITKKTINDYIIMLDKEEKKIDLNSDEKFLKQRSTLINFTDIIKL